MRLPAPTLTSVTTINEDGSRRFIHPADVRGRFSTWRAIVGILILAVYVGLPWITINGNPAVFLDLAHRQFHFFGLTFVTQDLWVAFFLISGLGFSLFYVTALLGRIWCGWACPQTVYLDVIRRIERWFEGDAPARARLDRMPWTGEKTLKRGGKNLVFLLFAALLAHVFLSYYVSPAGLSRMMTGAPDDNWGSFVFVFLMTGAMWFDFVWFREQFCIVLCPYGRLQSALIDTNTLVIGYDTIRGEPRGKKGTAGAGDCIDCLACVAVCPTGIDIREGPQIGCITCSLCIDACDQVMERIGRPKKLIGYTTEADEALASEGLPIKSPMQRLFRPRTMIYLGVWAAIGVAMLFSLGTRDRVVLDVAQSRNPVWVRLSDGQVRNSYAIKLRNMENRPRRFMLSVRGVNSRLWDETMQREAAAPTLTFEVPPDQVAKRTVYLAAPELGPAEQPILFTARPLDQEGGTAVGQARFERPEQGQ